MASVFADEEVGGRVLPDQRCNGGRGQRGQLLAGDWLTRQWIHLGDQRGNLFHPLDSDQVVPNLRQPGQAIRGEEAVTFRKRNHHVDRVGRCVLLLEVDQFPAGLIALEHE